MAQEIKPFLEWQLTLTKGIGTSKYWHFPWNLTRKSKLCSFRHFCHMPLVSTTRPTIKITDDNQRHGLFSVGDDLNQVIYKSGFKSFPTTYDFDLNQFSSHDS